LRARPAAREMAVLVLPTPPFWEAMDMIMQSSPRSLLEGFSGKLDNWFQVK